MTEFESQLSQTSPREIPAHWREEILAAAEKPDTATRRLGVLAAIWEIFRGLLWPHPAAWGAVAACWFLAAALWVSGPRGASLYVVTPPNLEPVGITPANYVLYQRAVEALLEEQPSAQPLPLDRSRL